MTIEPATGRVTRNEEYYALAHASRFVRRNAVRIESRIESRIEGRVESGAARGADTAADMSADGLSHVAFVNPEGDLVLVLVNERRESLTIGVPGGVIVMPARSVVTVTTPRLSVRR